MVRLIKTLIREGGMLRQSSKKKKKKGGGGGKALNPLPKGLILRYPTWLSRLSWAVKTFIPLPGDNKVVILHALVQLRKARY